MSNQHIETLIIGAGQAGLSTGYHLRQRGRPFLIVDGNERVGDNWRQQWDTLRLYTPAKYDGLPGLPFPGNRWAFPQKDAVADYLESYALHWDLSVRMSTRIDALEARAEGGYAASVGADTITVGDLLDPGDLVAGHGDRECLVQHRNRLRLPVRRVLCGRWDELAAGRLAGLPGTPTASGPR